MREIGEIEHWLESAHRNERIVYWSGYLASDRMMLEDVDGEIRSRRVDPADAIARMMWKAYRRGRVRLIQRRRSYRGFDYIAIRR